MATPRMNNDISVWQIDVQAFDDPEMEIEQVKWLLAKLVAQLTRKGYIDPDELGLDIEENGG